MAPAPRTAVPLALETARTVTDVDTPLVKRESVLGWPLPENVPDCPVDAVQMKLISRICRPGNIRRKRLE